MKPLQLTSIPESEWDLMVRELFLKWMDGDDTIRKAFDADDAVSARAAIVSYAEHQKTIEKVFCNNKYQVHLREHDDLVHLSIRRLDRKPIHDWRDLQEIKNQLLGEECEAVELYPAESRKVDSANQFHLWGFKSIKFRFPFGFNGGRFVSDSPLGKSVNRSLAKNH